MIISNYLRINKTTRGRKRRECNNQSSPKFDRKGAALDIRPEPGQPGCAWGGGYQELTKGRQYKISRVCDQDMCKAASAIWEALGGKPGNNLLVDLAEK